MNGEVKSWNMNEFYTWAEFKQMPDDIKVDYISALNKNYKLNQRAIAFTVFNIQENNFSQYLKRHGLKDKLNLAPYRREDAIYRANLQAIKELVLAPDDEPKKERPEISSLSFVMHGVDKERIADILSWFDSKDVTITLNITEKM